MNTTIRNIDDKVSHKLKVEFLRKEDVIVFGRMRRKRHITTYDAAERFQREKRRMQLREQRN